jgi:hypothetical protein
MAEERTMTVWNVTERGGLTETGIKVFEGTDSNERRTATTAREPVRKLAYQEILKERKRSLSRQTWFFSSHLQGLVRHHFYCWPLNMIIQMTCLQFQRSVSSLNSRLLFVISHFLYILDAFAKLRKTYPGAKIHGKTK